MGCPGAEHATMACCYVNLLFPIPNYQDKQNCQTKRTTDREQVQTMRLLFAPTPSAAAPLTVLSCSRFPLALAVSFPLHNEITQVTDSIAWVRCASGKQCIEWPTSFHHMLQLLLASVCQSFLWQLWDTCFINVGFDNDQQTCLLLILTTPAGH